MVKKGLNPLAWQMLRFVTLAALLMKTKTISLFLGLSALVCLADARAITIAENTAGTTALGTGFFGQSFTTAPGSPTSNIAFNFFSHSATTPVAVGNGFLLSTLIPRQSRRSQLINAWLSWPSDGRWWLLHIRPKPDPLTKYAILFLRECAVTSAAVRG